MLQTTVGGTPFGCCIYNASGPRTGSIEALAKIGRSKSGAILAKSATLMKQDGNTLPRFINKIKLGDLCDGSLNSEGLPNSGVDYYISDQALSELSKFKKPYIVSISGLSLEDNLTMLKLVLAQDFITGIELNIACPNIPNKPIIAYDFEQMDSVLAAVTRLSKDSNKSLGLKMAPYLDPMLVERAASIIVKYPVHYIVCTNTVGNGLIVDYENECGAIAAKGGFGGLGGGFIKPVALANVRMMFQKLSDLGRSDIDIVGVGGVHTGIDAFEMILCGARAVQVATCHWTEGPSCFERIANELQNIMKAKGYTTIEDFRGKLKPYVKPKNRSASSEVSGTKGETTSSRVGNDNIYVTVIVALLSVLAYVVMFGIHI